MLIVSFSRLKCFIITNDKEAAGNQEQDKEISDYCGFVRVPEERSTMNW